MKNKFISIILLSLLASSCNNTNNSSFNNNQAVISEIKKNDEGKTYYSVDDKPITPIGVQIRTDLLIYEENKDFTEIEKYFQIAKDIGFTLVEIPIRWKDCEKSEGIYNFKDLGKILTIANNLSLKVEILLFGTNTTGWSDNVPQYIKDDEIKYPRYKSINTPSGLFLKQDDEKLLDKEGKWVNALMDSISLWSENNNNAHVVSAIQIHNESDTFPRFILAQQNIMTIDETRKLSDIEAWKETLTAYDYLGKIVKNSSYKCLTRVNVAQAYKDSWQGFVKDIFDLEGIDIVGDDTYEQTVTFNKMVIEDFNSEDIFNKNNFPHISENDGSYISTPSLILASIAMGGGYMVYDLATPEIATTTYGWDDWSLIDNKTLAYKEHTYLTKDIILGINKAGSDMILTNNYDIMAFNVIENTPQDYKKQTIQTTKAMISFETNNKAMGYAITNEKYIDLFFTNDCNITIYNVNYEKTLYTGYVDYDGNFIKETENPITSDTLSLKGNTFYRINVNNIENTLKSNSIKFIGG